MESEEGVQSVCVRHGKPIDPTDGCPKCVELYNRSLIFDGEFPLDWLLDGEAVKSAGDGTGAAVVVRPDGSEVRLNIGDRPAKVLRGKEVSALTERGTTKADRRS